MTQLNVVLLVVDSLRAQALSTRADDRPPTPFLDGLSQRSVTFRRAHATECWTLPTHMSMFTGLLPSEHGAHFQTMGYAGTAPTIAEILAGAGYATEIVTRNSIFDGSLPGVTRGFARNTRVYSPRSRGLNPLAAMLALSKPRFRRQIRESGFFHPLQREQKEFLLAFSRATVPADRDALACAHARMRTYRASGEPYFLFVNLYDVHAPYPPSPQGIFRPWRSWAAVGENLTMPFVLPYLGGHAYLRPGFRLSARSRRLLLARYHAAIAMMDAKLAAFCAGAEAEGLLEDTLLIVTSDHGEAFGDHGLYLHDASVYQTHLHVPLFVRHPMMAPEVVDDVASTRDLFGLMRAAADGGRVRGTLLDAAFRGERPVALAEHFYYPHAERTAPEYRQNLTAVISADHKVILRRERTALYDLATDPDEERPQSIDARECAGVLQAEGLPAAAADRAVTHLARAVA